MNKIINPYIAVSIFMFLGVARLSAQTDQPLNKEVEVVKAYQPTITDAIKIVAMPKIIDTVSYIPSFKYQIKSSGISTERTINRLPSVPLGNAPKTETKTGFLKLAGGNALTPVAEFFLNTNPSKNSEFGVHLYHFSSRPKIKLDNGLKEKTTFSNNMVGLFAKNYFRRSVLEWEASYQRDRFSYYGFPHPDSLLYHQNEPFSATLAKKQIFNQASTQFCLSNFNAKGKTDYRLALGYTYFWNATGQNVHKGNLDGNLKIALNKFDVLSGGQIGYYYQNHLNNASDLNTIHHKVFAAIDPQIAFSGKLWEVKAGLNLAMVVGDDSTSAFHISPKTYFAFTPIDGILTLFAGTDGRLVPNDYISAVQSNPYLHFTSNLLPSQTSLLLYGGFKGKISRNISYLFDVNYSLAKDEIFYYQSLVEYEDAKTIVDNTFKAKYEKLNTLKFGGQIRYSGNNFNLSLSGNYYSYASKTARVTTNRPIFDATLASDFEITSKISVQLGGTITGPRKAELETTLYSINTSTGLYDIPVLTWSNPELKTMIETHLKVNYKLNKKLSFFLSADNILNQNHQKWYGYNAPGLLILGGANFIF